jgi:hypothetical protein
MGLVACGTTGQFAQLREDSTKRPSPHSFLPTHSAAQVSDPTTRQALSAEDASALAAQLANEQCERQYRKRPFKSDSYPVVLEDGIYHWGKLDVGGPGGFSALVTFYPDGSEPRVEVYFSSDALQVRRLR